jgi:hypothetical protein
VAQVGSSLLLSLPGAVVGVGRTGALATGPSWGVSLTGATGSGRGAVATGTSEGGKVTAGWDTKELGNRRRTS